MAKHEVDNFEAALYDTTQRIIEKAVALGESRPDDLTNAVAELLLNEAPEGMPLSWVMYIKEIAAALGEEKDVDVQRRALLRRVGNALVEAIDEGEVTRH